MTKINRTFDDEYFGKVLGKELHKAIIRKSLSLAEVERIIGMAQPHLSTLLNGRRTTRNLDQYKKVASGIGLTEAEFSQMVVEARTKEYMFTLGKEPDIAYQLTLEAVLSRDFGISDEDAVVDIIKYAKLLKNNKK